MPTSTTATGTRSIRSPVCLYRTGFCGRRQPTGPVSLPYFASSTRRKTGRRSSPWPHRRRSGISSSSWRNQSPPAHKRGGRFLRSLPPPAYRVLFRLNDRQGELFFYMHSQMLARYDTERLSLGMERVKPFGPDLFGKPIPEGYSPNLPDYTARAPDEALPQRDVQPAQQMAGRARYRATRPRTAPGGRAATGS